MKTENIKNFWESVFVVAMFFTTTATVLAVPPQPSGGVVPIPPGSIVPVPPGEQQNQQPEGSGQPSDEGGGGPPGPHLTLSPTFADLGMYSIHEPQWITYSFNVTNTGAGTLTWFIEGFPWWVAYITINGQQGYSGTCAAGQTKVFTIHVCTGWLEDPYEYDNPYEGTINLTSDANDATATVIIDMVDPECPGFELWDYSFPSDLEPGDLLFMDAKPWIIEHVGIPYDPVNADHVALYVGMLCGVHWFIESNNYTLFNTHLGNLSIPFLGSGVRMHPWCLFCFWATNFDIGKVNGATMQQKNGAKLFERTRLRYHDKYQSAYPGYPPYWKWCNPNITDPSNPYYQTYYFPNDPFIDFWFCSELAWASYLHATPPINLDAYPDSDGTIPGYGIPGYRVGPKNLYDSPNITIIHVNEEELIPQT